MVFAKFDFNGDMRRMSFKECPTLAQLRALLRTTYTEDTSDCAISYLDNERDHIMVTSDVDLREAFDYFSRRDDLLRFYLTRFAAPASPAPAPAVGLNRQAEAIKRREARKAARSAELQANAMLRHERQRHKHKERSNAHAAQDAAQKERSDAAQKERADGPCAAPSLAALGQLLSVAQPLWALVAPYWSQLREMGQQAFQLAMENPALRRFVRRVVIPSLHQVLSLPLVRSLLEQFGIQVSREEDAGAPSCSSARPAAGPCASSSCGPCPRRAAPRCGGGMMHTAPPACHMAICDACEKRIVGVRFKCMHCPDFDLCESCIVLRGQIGHPAAHEFLRIDARSPGVCPMRCPRPEFGAFVAPSREAAPRPAPAPSMPTTFAMPDPTVDEIKVEPKVEFKVEEIKVEEEEEVKVEDDKPTLEERVRKVAHNESEASKLLTLGSMGFDDLEITVSVLRRNRGNLMATVNDLIRT